MMRPLLPILAILRAAVRRGRVSRAKTYRREAEEQAERERIERERAEAERAEAKRARDREHCATIHREIVADLQEMGLSYADARYIVTAISRGRVRHLRVDY